VGIDSYDKMDISLKAKLIEEAIDTPYARSGRKAAASIEISSQSVMNGKTNVRLLYYFHGRCIIKISLSI